jgi:hypothetical protein
VSAVAAEGKKLKIASRDKISATAATFTCKDSSFLYFVYRDRLASELFNEGGSMERSPYEVADYLKTLCSEMTVLAGKAGLKDLAYLLAMCVEEAESNRAPPRVSRAKKRKKA